MGTVWMKFEPTYFTEMGATGTDTELEVAFGVDVDLTAAPNGAYSYELVWTYDSTADNCDVTGQLKGFYLPTAAVTAATDLGNGMTDAVNIYYDSGTSPQVRLDLQQDLHRCRRHRLQRRSERLLL